MSARETLSSGREQLRTIRKQMDTIKQHQSMTAEEKRAALEGLIIRRNRAARQAVESAKARMR
jgi:DNA-binding PadR family transcriptional regulator